MHGGTVWNVGLQSSQHRRTAYTMGWRFQGGISRQAYCHPVFSKKAVCGMTLPFIIGSRDQMRMAWPTQDLNRQLPPNKNQKDAVVGQARGINFGPLSLSLSLSGGSRQTIMNGLKKTNTKGEMWVKWSAKALSRLPFLRRLHSVLLAHCPTRLSHPTREPTVQLRVRKKGGRRCRAVFDGC